MITTLCSFFGALIARLLAAELYAWMPTLADWLLMIYVRFLPKEIGERLLEEWRALLHDTPGNMSKLLRAADLGRTILFTMIEAKGLKESCRTETLSQEYRTDLSEGKQKVLSEDIEARVKFLEKKHTDQIYFKTRWLAVLDELDDERRKNVMVKIGLMDAE